MATKTTKSTRTTKSTTRKKAPARKAAPAKATPRIVETVIPEAYRPISMWGYFLWEIVYTIPLIGWIILVCQAFAAKNRNLRNFARSKFCWLIIYIIIICALAGLGVLTVVCEKMGWV